MFCNYKDDCPGCICTDKTRICLHCWENHHDKWLHNIPYEKKIEKKCTCGAKHTSRKDYHLDWCDKEKK